jgi:hypothetical protein
MLSGSAATTIGRCDNFMNEGQVADTCLGPSNVGFVGGIDRLARCKPVSRALGIMHTVQNAAVAPC